MTTLEYRMQDGPTWLRLVEALVVDSSLRWTVFDAWFVAARESCDARRYEEITASPDGFTVGSAELARLAPHLLQVIDAVIIGWQDSPPLRGSSDIRATAEVVIEAVDSTFWRIYSREPETFAVLRRDFPGGRELSPEPAIPSVRLLS